ncbi:MAG: ATP-binding protein [Candidatus Cloacimonetes bacterium]|nr:ATP-binding protein [Candidatus Cloacimonadota bacterium]
MTRLIGRDKEIQLLNQSIQDSSGGSCLLSGITGSGKTYLLRHWYEPSFNIRGRKAWHTCINPLMPAQEFVKSLARELWMDLNPEEQNFVTIALQAELGKQFSFPIWLIESDQHLLKDGYVFLEFLKILRNLHDTGIVLIIDQCELLSPESRLLLKHVNEWKPLGVYIFMALRSSDISKESISRDFGSTFFFKGCSHLEVHPLGAEFEDEYRQAWGIQTDDNQFHYMEYAVYQKRGWLLEQLQDDKELRQTFLWLAQYPYGVPHGYNRYLNTLKKHLAQRPQLEEIFHFRRSDLVFSNIQHVYDLYDHFSEEMPPLEPPPSGLGDWELCHRVHLSLTHNLEKLEEIRLLARRYAQTFSIRGLKEMTEVLGDILEPEIPLALLNVAQGHLDPKEILAVVMPNLKPDWEHPLTALCLHSFSRLGQLPLLVEHADSIPEIHRSRTLSLIIFHAMQQDPESVLQSVEKLNLPKEFKQACLSLGKFLFGNDNLDKAPFRHGHLATVSRLARAIEMHENGANNESLALLETCVRDAKQSLDLGSLTCAYQKISDIMETLEDFDNQLKFYRLAVVAGVFTP